MKKTKGDVKKAKPRPTLPAKFWAMILKYEPFTMGGELWRPVRYETDGEPLRVGRFACFAFRNEVLRRWQVHEVSSGGMLGDGRTRADAVACARTNVCRTPDLAKQIKAHGAVARHAVVPRAWALRVGRLRSAEAKR